MPQRPFPTAVIVTALEVETRAVLRHLGKYDVETVSGTGFFKGQFEGWDIAVVEAGPGNAGAAAIAVRALGHYKPHVALFVGVAGGVKDVAIGDVVVATKVYGYESGKDTAKGFQPRPDVQNTAHALEQRARVIRQGTDWKSRLDPAIKHEDPAFFVAPIAAGEKVVASQEAATAKLIKEHYGDAIAVEMEGSGFLKGVHISHPTQGAVIRGISDLLSGKASADKAGSQQRAADAASAAAFEILSGLDGGQRKTKPVFLRTQSTYSKGSYFTQGQVLAEIGVPGVDQVQFAFADAPDGYMRIIPMERREKPLTLSSLNASVNQSEMIRATGYGGLSTVNAYGAIYYDPAGAYPMGPAPLRWATQVFQNGELWSLTDTLITRERAWRPADVPLPLIPALTLEQGFYRALHKNIAFAVAHLGLTFPCEVELGLVSMRGAHLGVDQQDIRGPIKFDEAVVQMELSSADAAAIDAALLTFFTEVFDKTGYARPEGLNRFPPGPPRS
ncbi:5'-methylthioadenosine/S-adenosylhomocysteine nucleosidase [Bradyrhizobium tropiciagri]|uniref:5'-methylthioadenosine/S-adenosylhomocysteine nucleosidase family protein n=1 Tax=Bradyrhizobium tropiciagri TaxID=312253 RepID=UPI001BAD6A75|nr:5'-methylthioadenosine/S-adenosylhomocysteine nucleosidase [Bradyrhizobium tropiciagri]